MMMVSLGFSRWSYVLPCAVCCVSFAQVAALCVSALRVIEDPACLLVISHISWARGGDDNRDQDDDGDDDTYHEMLVMVMMMIMIMVMAMVF